MKSKPRALRRRSLYVSAVLALALGCAKQPTEAESGGGAVQRYGDQFMVSESDFLGVGGAREKAVREANSFCDKRGQRMMPDREEATGTRSMSLFFRCIGTELPYAVPTR